MIQWDGRHPATAGRSEIYHSLLKGESIMADPFIGQITMFGGNFAPRSWALCNGQLLDIASNSALFSILGTSYGGDGRTTFGLPDFRGRVPMNWGQGAGLSSRTIGQKGGAETVVLTTQQIPQHSHLMRGSSGQPDESNPQNGVPASSAATGQDLYASTSNVNMGATANTGGSQAHTNMQPFQVVSFIIAIVGVFPSRN